MIGKVVQFKVVHSAASGREYGTIALESGEDMAAYMVSSGWARARPNKEDAAGAAAGAAPAAPAVDPSAPKSDRDALIQLDDQAKAAGLGMHGAASAAQDHVRTVNYSVDTRAVFDKYKGQVIPGIVDQVRDGSTMRIELIDPKTPLQHMSIVPYCSIATQIVPVSWLLTPEYLISHVLFSLNVFFFFFFYCPPCLVFA